LENPQGGNVMDRFETFAVTIAQISRCVQKIKAIETEAIGLKSTHVMCLYALGKAPEGLTSSQLCKLCGEDKAAVSRSVSELTGKGYVRPDNALQGRAYRTKIHLTETGRETVRYINQRVDRALDAVGEGLSPEQRETFYQALTLIAGNLQNYISKKEEFL